MVRHIAIVTGSRGEMGALRPLIREIERRPGLDYRLLVTNLHILPEFGYSVQELEQLHARIGERIYMAFDGYTPASMAKSIGVFLLSVTDAFVRQRPDIILLIGDRGEQLAAAFAGATMNIPVAHIQAGERSGNIDGLTRHAIARFTHLHFAANEDARDRLVKAGEEPWRVHLTGSPYLDDLVLGEHASPEEVAAALHLDLAKPVVLLVLHPVTEEFEATAAQTGETLEAVIGLGHQTVAIFPNNDAGSGEVRKVLERYKRANVRIERNLPRRMYAGLMRVASVMVGNSSSGLIEAPVFKLPAVNVGDRQRDRFRGKNVLDVPVDRKAIAEAIERAMRKEFRAGLFDARDNPYNGDGHVSKRIVDVLETVPLDDKLLRKQLTY